MTSDRKLWVIKCGGGSSLNRDSICDDLAELWRQGRRFVLVHGGSHETNRISELLGHPPRFVTSLSGQVSRYTDRDTLEIFTMVYAGKVNKGWVASLQRRGLPALGMSGADGGLVRGRKKGVLKIVENGKQKILRQDRSGSVESVNTPLLRLLLDAHYLPVVTPPALGEGGELLNVDGDLMASRIAEALGAKVLIFLSDVPGLLRDLQDENSLIPVIRAEDLATAHPFASGRMKKKLLAAEKALGAGVSRVVLADGRVSHPLLKAMEGGGTHLISGTPHLPNEYGRDYPKEK